jgi:hypothetical protein
MEKKYKDECMFFMRFENNTGEDVLVEDLLNLFDDSTGKPKLLTATINTDNRIKSIKGRGNKIKKFIVKNNKCSIFKITWHGGLFSLAGDYVDDIDDLPVRLFQDSYKDLVVSSGFELHGNYDIPDNFMDSLFAYCSKYRQQRGDSFDVKGLNPTKIGDRFLMHTWYGCKSLKIPQIPDTSGWQITSIGTHFLCGTWFGCSALRKAVVPNTITWKINCIDILFCANTWGCTPIVKSVVPDTTNWDVSEINWGFFHDTWTCCTSLTEAAVPNTANWKVSGVLFEFFDGTWSNCEALTNAVVPDTTNWNVSEIGNFFSGTWFKCVSLKKATTPYISEWNIKAIYDGFFYDAWYGCDSLLERPDIYKLNEWLSNHYQEVKYITSQIL